MAFEFHGIKVENLNGNIVFRCKTDEQITDLMTSLDPSVSKDMLDKFIGNKHGETTHEDGIRLMSTEQLAVLLIEYNLPYNLEETINWLKQKTEY